MILHSREGVEVSYATNNQTKYKAFITDFKLAQALQTKKVKIHIDSQLVLSHINESFQPRGEKMKLYL